MASKSIPNNPSNLARIVGLDVGSKRIGVASVGRIAKLPQPLKILENSESVFADIQEIVKQEGADLVVVGIPRNLDGEETAQSKEIREFATRLQVKTGLDIAFADESLSSRRAEQMTKDYGAKGAGLDALAACFILEEFLLKETTK